MELHIYSGFDLQCVNTLAWGIQFIYGVYIVYWHIILILEANSLILFISYLAYICVTKVLYSSCSGTTAKSRSSVAVTTSNQISVKTSVGAFPA